MRKRFSIQRASESIREESEMEGHSAVEFDPNITKGPKCEHNTRVKNGLKKKTVVQRGIDVVAGQWNHAVPYLHPHDTGYLPRLFIKSISPNLWNTTTSIHSMKKTLTKGEQTKQMSPVYELWKHIHFSIFSWGVRLLSPFICCCSSCTGT